jgi:alpha-D-ribose 1-methylphosphonate 5-triphosphate synthase subunit PhnG
VIAPFEEAQRESRHLGASRSAATKVEFFTLVRGED